MKVKQIYHIGLPCNDLERAVKFYTEVLGMKCTKVGYDTESGGPYKEKYGMFPNIARLFMEDGMCLVLFQRPSSVERGDFDEGTSHLALEVGSDDFDKASDELKKAGVKVLIDQPVVRPTGSACSGAVGSTSAPSHASAAASSNGKTRARTLSAARRSARGSR